MTLYVKKMQGAAWTCVLILRVPAARLRAPSLWASSPLGLATRAFFPRISRLESLPSKDGRKGTTTKSKRSQAL